MVQPCGGHKDPEVCNKTEANQGGNSKEEGYFLKQSERVQRYKVHGFVVLSSRFGSLTVRI